jgi:hypothetical protein
VIRRALAAFALAAALASPAAASHGPLPGESGY